MTDKFKLCHEYKLFNDLSTEQMQAVGKICREECFYPDTILFEDGEPAQKMYVLVEGEIKVFYAIGEAGMVEVDKVEPGEIFGCSALVPPYLHTSTALAKTRIEVLELDAVGLRGLFEEDPRLGVSIQQHVIRCLIDCIIDLRLG
jgi:signal-transduction protein with cAMP-binding, CBS, and nucleotidyltransferase domain